MTTETQLKPTAKASPGPGRTNFLYGPCRFGHGAPYPVMGSSPTEATVTVFDDSRKDTHPVILRFQQGGFGFQSGFTPAEARTLAEALIMGADKAEESKRQNAEVAA